MTIKLALEYIPGRMKELGYGDDYSIQFRHFVLPAKEEIKVNAENQLLLLIEPVDTVSVESDAGIFDVTIDYVNELQYEHQGSVRIRNYAAITQHARFIQVIPKTEKPCP